MAMKRFVIISLLLLGTLNLIRAQSPVDSLTVKDSVEVIPVVTKVNADSLYKANYLKVLGDIEYFVSRSASYRDEITNVWHEAIYNGKYKGKWVKDFDTALSKHFAERRESWLYQSYLSMGGEVKGWIKSLNKYPPHLEDAFEGMLELGIMVDEFFGAVVSPDGSYNSYSESTRNLYSKIKRQMYELEMRYTD